MKKTYLLVLVFLTLRISCQAQSTNNFDHGTISKSIYSNVFFDFTLPIPKDWHVQNEDQKKVVAAETEKLLAGEDQNLKALLKASEVNAANLLTVFQFEKGAPVDFNPGIGIVAENITNSPGVKTGKDYLFHVRKLMERTQINYDFDPEVHHAIISGKEFYLLNITMQIGNMTAAQTYYTTIINGFALNFVIVYNGKEQEEMMSKIVRNVKFNKKK